MKALTFRFDFRNVVGVDVVHMSYNLHELIFYSCGMIICKKLYCNKYLFRINSHSAATGELKMIRIQRYTRSSVKY